jgi:hypothetical protein
MRWSPLRTMTQQTPASWQRCVWQPSPRLHSETHAAQVEFLSRCILEDAVASPHSARALQPRLHAALHISSPWLSGRSLGQRIDIFFSCCLPVSDVDS